METLAWVYFYASAFVVVVILSAAARHKVRFSGDFIGALTGYRLLPEGVLIIWWVVPTLEALAVAEILFSYGQSRWLAAALFSLYGAAIATNLLRGRQHIDCGCGGEGTPISWGLVLRNAVLLLIALPLSTPDGGFTIIMGFLVVLTGALGLLAYAIVNQMFANAAR